MRLPCARCTGRRTGVAGEGEDRGTGIRSAAEGRGPRQVEGDKTGCTFGEIELPCSTCKVQRDEKR